jgi:hypothetical protein
MSFGLSIDSVSLGIATERSDGGDLSPPEFERPPPHRVSGKGFPPSSASVRMNSKRRGI